MLQKREVVKIDVANDPVDRRVSDTAVFAQLCYETEVVQLV